MLWSPVMCRLCPAAAVVAADVTVAAAAAAGGGTLVAMSGMTVVEVMSEGCAGEVMRVVQVIVCCAMEVMLWYECEYACSVRTPRNGATPVHHLRDGGG